MRPEPASTRRLASTLLASLLLHGVAISAVLPGTLGTAGEPDVVVVELAGAGDPAAPRSELAEDRTLVDERASGSPSDPAASVWPPSPAIDDRLAALVAERDQLAARLDTETAARDRLGTQVAALAAENFALESELTAERKRAERLEQSLARRRAEADVAMRQLQETHDALVAALRDEIADRDVELRRAREGLTVSVVDRVLFPSGQAELTPEGRDVIDRIARVLAATPLSRVVIEGHTDNVPIGPELSARFPSNWELSTARATEVVRHLVERGLPAGALEAVGRADTRPVMSNDTEASRRHNRRIAIIVPGSPAPPSEAPEPEA